jgi:hypothetical protein
VIKYKDWEIPMGTPVSMTSVLMHQNEEKFPDPERVDSEIWVDPAERKRLDKYMVAFFEGNEGLLGYNVWKSRLLHAEMAADDVFFSLAWAELYMITAAVFLRFDFELYETTYEDHVKSDSDMFFPHPKRDSGEFRVLVK